MKTQSEVKMKAEKVIEADRIINLFFALVHSAQSSMGVAFAAN